MTATIVQHVSRNEKVDWDDPMWCVVANADFASIRTDVPGQLWQRVAEGKRRD